ncbi:MAG: hypothetical protein LBP34_02405 [Flavobacteriaceae bacterium]|jgi:hypothetical protein|nr:hypothetical protein [Flavobacteriaceae bacterium]
MKKLFLFFLSFTYYSLFAQSIGAIQSIDTLQSIDISQSVDTLQSVGDIQNIGTAQNVDTLWDTNTVQSIDTRVAEVIEPDKESRDYHEYRIGNSIPPYALSKIKNKMLKLDKGLIGEEVKRIEDNGEYYFPLSEKDFSKLSVKEKFAYTMIYPENKPLTEVKEEVILDEDKKIFGNLVPVFTENGWSERQRNFLGENRKEVIGLIKESALKDRRLGLNYKIALKEMNAVETIPFLVDFYTTKDKKDRDILTLLILLMNDNKYYPFTRSNVYHALYGNDKQSLHESSIEYSKMNEEYIVKTANNFYVQHPKRR